MYTILNILPVLRVLSIGVSVVPYLQYIFIHSLVPVHIYKQLIVHVHIHKKFNKVYIHTQFSTVHIHTQFIVQVHIHKQLIIVHIHTQFSTVHIRIQFSILHSTHVCTVLYSTLAYTV